VKYYPAFVNLKDKKAVVIGGGKVAERKVRILIMAGALVTVISPTLTTSLAKLKEKEKLAHIKRNYKKGDLKDAFIVIAGTSSVMTNKKISRDARNLINVTDTPSEGNFIVPSLVKRGYLTIAISTEGASPALSKAVRKEIERLYGTEFALYVRFVEAIRKKALEKIGDNKKREKFLKSLASGKVLHELRHEGFSVTSEKIRNSFNKLAGIKK
jgi:precorrin-2 dehydrogenase/sirohydrochlorin ferrochelatase